MRGTRWLLLVAIAAILGGVGISYRAQKKVLRDQAVPKPQPLPPELTSLAPVWTSTQVNPDGSSYTVQAEDFRQQKDSGRIDLKNVELKLFNKNGKTYDLMKTAAAEYFEAERRMHTEGEAEITLDVPLDGAQPNQMLVSIKSSGVMLDATTGRVETDRLATFVFRNGEGKSMGAWYNPTARELVMKSEVELHWKSDGPAAKPTKIEGGSLTYHEATSEIWLKPWGRVTRENSVVEGNDDIIRLAESGGRRYIRQIEANAARGVDAYPKRKLQYSAGFLVVDFNEGGEAQKITGLDNAHFVSTAETSETAVNASRVELNFNIQGNDSLLSTVNASGNAEVASRPLPAPGRQPSETHVLRAANFDMKMRPDGREIETVVTRSPSSLEFLPNLPTQHHRTVDGNDFVIAYAPQNRVESFRAKDARTRTEPTVEERKRNRAVSVTTSREMVARFDPKTSRVATIEQAGDFTYEEGPRHARASKATLDSEQNVILLETSARVWDESGSTSSDRIRMDQRTGNFTAEGRVYSSRIPDKNKKQDSQMLSGDEPLLAQARRMESTKENRVIHYEGDAVMRQGANQIQADAIDVDREKRTLVAAGNVLTNLWEQPRNPQPKPGGRTSAPPAGAVLTVVRAARMVYTDENRLAYYSGGVTLQRANLRVKSNELRAFLSPSGADSSLEKAVCDGGVEMVQTTPGHARTGTGDHGEYYAAEQKVIMRGRRAKLVEMVNGRNNATEGLELTYWSNDDRLLVNGAPDDPVRSRIVRNRK